MQHKGTHKIIERQAFTMESDVAGYGKSIGISQGL